MEKSEFFEVIVLAVLLVATAIGCIGAFFYDWTWHNLLLGITAGWFAGVIIRALVNEYKDTQNTTKVQK